MKTKANVILTVEELERSMKIAARVVALYGEIYLPLFNRLHEELRRRKECQDQNALALKLALSYTVGE